MPDTSLRFPQQIQVWQDSHSLSLTKRLTDAHSAYHPQNRQPGLQSVLQSRNVTILGYIKRQFKKVSTAEFVQNITPNESEKQALMITFMKAFFGYYSINLLCPRMMFI